MMGLDISSGAKQKQKQQEYTKQSVARGVEEKIRTQICDDKEEVFKGSKSEIKKSNWNHSTEETRNESKKNKEKGIVLMYSVVPFWSLAIFSLLDTAVSVEI